MDELRRYIRSLLIESKSQEAVESLANQYYNMRASGKTDLGDIGEQIALVLIGASTDDNWRVAQQHPCSTNKWSNDFPLVDVMDNPLEASSGGAESTVFYSVKTGGSSQNWRSLYRLVNLPTTGSSKGIRNILENDWGGKEPDVISLDIGLIHVDRNPKGVTITHYEPISLIWEKTEYNVLDGLSLVPQRPVSWGRGGARKEWCQQRSFYQPTNVPATRPTKPQVLWKNIRNQEFIAGSVDSTLAASLSEPAPTRVGLVSGRRRLPGAGKLKRLLDNPSAFVAEWYKHSSAENIFLQSYQRWYNRMIKKGLTPKQTPSSVEEELGI